jgi:hypothetical protein
MTKAADEIAQLKQELADQRARVEELERANKPKEPFVPQPHQRYDPTAGMSMPDSALAAMVAAEPRNFMRDVVRDNRAPTTPAMIPSSQSTGGGGSAPVNTSGWREATPLGPPPGVAQADRLMDEADRRDRLQLAERLAKQEAMERLAEDK